MELRGVKTWFEKGRMVELTDDVLGVLRDIKEISPRIAVFYNEQVDEYDLVEHCSDGVDRLVFSVKELDARVPLRLRMADQWRGREDPTYILPESEDFLTKMDQQYEREDAEEDEQNRDRILEVGERLAWALEEDRKGVGAQILIP